MNAVSLPRKKHPRALSADQVIAVINRPEDVAAARMEFREAGFPPRDVVVMAGGKALRRLDSAASRRGFFDGLRNRLRRLFVDADLQSPDRQAEELRAGHALIGVLVRRTEERRSAEAILMRCHGHFICCCDPATLTRAAAA